MGSKRSPIGSIPSTKESGGSEDVKTESTASEKVEPESVKESKADSESELDEKDLDALREQKNVPYSRFKEVNEEKKTYQQQLKEMERRYQEAESRAQIASRMQSQSHKEDEIDLSLLDDSIVAKENRELKNQLQSVLGRLERIESSSKESGLRSQIAEAKARFPEADELAVLGWAKTNPQLDILELAEMSHNRTVEAAERQLNKLLEQKKERAKKASIPTMTGGLNLKGQEKPKSISEAMKLVRKFTS